MDAHSHAFTRVEFKEGDGAQSLDGDRAMPECMAVDVPRVPNSRGKVMLTCAAAKETGTHSNGSTK
ncbi:hypothetical protein BCEP4_130071 [Burkholderia cepacia]|nr:hypothetical protein BCEP4_130071 [Burkholderia cepacia]